MYFNDIFSLIDHGKEVCNSEEEINSLQIHFSKVFRAQVFNSCCSETHYRLPKVSK